MAKGKDFEQLGCQVVVMDTGTRGSGLEWLQKHNYNFPLFLDRDRVFYRQLGMRRFLKKSFCVKTFQLYAYQIIAGTFQSDNFTAGIGARFETTAVTVHTSVITSLKDFSEGSWLAKNEECFHYRLCGSIGSILQ